MKILCTSVISCWRLFCQLSASLASRYDKFFRSFEWNGSRRWCFQPSWLTPVPILQYLGISENPLHKCNFVLASLLSIVRIISVKVWEFSVSNQDTTHSSQPGKKKRDLCNAHYWFSWKVFLKFFIKSLVQVCAILEGPFCTFCIEGYFDHAINPFASQLAFG